MEKNRVLEEARRIIDLFYQGKAFWKSEYFNGVMCLSTTDFELSCNTNRVIAYLEKLGKRKYMVIHDKYSLLQMSEKAVMVVGSYLIQTKPEKEHYQWYEITLLLQIAADVMVVRHIQITEKHEKPTRVVKDIDERKYLLSEREILYLEAQHNHVLWHCRDKVVEAVGCLKALAIDMPEYFIRIHKSLLVNRKHVREISRYEVLLDNGEKLPIPIKRYQTVKGQLEEETLFGEEAMNRERRESLKKL